MRDRSDFIENLKMAQVHLMILVEDIRYELPEDRQELLMAAYHCMNELNKREMMDAFKEAAEKVERGE